MTLSAGQRLGLYEIVEPIGAGGMGVVYRARDTKLERDVAIKVLPEELSRDAERLARFEREARLLAQLNHTNIAVLHGFEKDDSRQFLVMELVEGDTLAERIARGASINAPGPHPQGSRSGDFAPARRLKALPVDEAITLFIQIAEGLEAAHEKGIVHRDLKPANVKITPDDHIKILDFGLAKAFLSEEDVSAETSQSPTLTKNTALGAIMGTASYMSPEQARGKTVDKRTDIWAFGCCLYEALTGKKAFEGETVTDIIAAVVHKEPDWDVLPASVPRRVRHLIERCLRKNARERVRDIGDARLELLEKEGEAGGAAVPSKIKTAAIVAPIVALMLGFVARGALETAESSRPMHLSVAIAPSERVGDAGAATSFLIREQGLTRTSIALSPDGQRLVFVGWQDGQQKLFLRPLEAPDARVMPGTEDALNPFFSPDGEWVGFWSDGALKKVAVSGGPPVPLCSVPPVFGASWRDDDTIVFTGYRTDLMVVEAGGGIPRALVENTDLTQWTLPWPVDDANAVLFTLRREGISWGDTDIVAHSLASGETTTLVEGGAQPMVTESGHLLYVKLGVVWATPFDPAKLEVLGSAVPVIEGVVQNVQDGSINNRTGAAQITVSASGNLAFLAGTLVEDVGRTLVWVDRSGDTEPLPFDKGRFWAARVSSDGDRIAFAEPEGVSILDLRRAVRQRLPASDLDVQIGSWSPDGTRIAFSDPGSRAESLYWQLADGSEPPEVLLSSDAVNFVGPWNPDGSEILFTESNDRPSVGVTQWDISALGLPPTGGSPRPVLAEPAFNENYPALSPDGRWLAYASDESGSYEVYPPFVSEPRGQTADLERRRRDAGLVSKRG